MHRTGSASLWFTLKQIPRRCAFLMELGEEMNQDSEYERYNVKSGNESARSTINRLPDWIVSAPTLSFSVAISSRARARSTKVKPGWRNCKQTPLLREAYFGLVGSAEPRGR